MWTRPEIQDAACERELLLTIRSRDRLTQLMSFGYAIHWDGRLVSVTLADGPETPARC